MYLVIEKLLCNRNRIPKLLQYSMSIKFFTVQVDGKSLFFAVDVFGVSDFTVVDVIDKIRDSLGLAQGRLECDGVITAEDIIIYENMTFHFVDYVDVMKNLPLRIPTISAQLVSSYPDTFCTGSWRGSNYLLAWIKEGLNDESKCAIASRAYRWIRLIRSVVPNILVFTDQNNPSSNEFINYDTSLYLNGALILKAGIKFSDFDLNLAEKELTCKFSADAIQVFPSGHQTIIGYTLDLMKTYTINFEEQRIEFTVDIMKLLRWIVAIQGPNSKSQLFPDIRRNTSNGHYITWGREGLLKEFNTMTTDLAVTSRISDVYKRHLPHVEWGRVVEQHKLLITRIGIAIQDAIQRNLITTDSVIEDIRLALDELHAVELAHCDVFAKNVFYDSKECCAFLSDLEYLTPLDDAPPNTKWFGKLPTCASDLDSIQFQMFISYINTMQFA
eukprot:gene9698-20157_t